MASSILRSVRWLLAVSIGILFLRGCGRPDQDVTNDPAFGNFSSIAGTWHTKTPSKIVERDQALYLVSDDTVMSGSQEIVREPAGVRLRIEHLMFRKTVESDLLWVTGSLVEGEYAGRTVQLDSNFFPWDLVLHYQLHHDKRDATTKPSWTVAPDKLEK